MHHTCLHSTSPDPMVVHGTYFFNFAVSEVPSEISTNQMHERVIHALLPVSLFSFPMLPSTFNFPVVLPCLGDTTRNTKHVMLDFFFKVSLVLSPFMQVTKPNDQRYHFWCALWWSINHASCLPWFAMLFTTARALLIGPFPPLCNMFSLITSMRSFDD